MHEVACRQTIAGISVGRKACIACQGELTGLIVAAALDRSSSRIRSPNKLTRTINFPHSCDRRQAACCVLSARHCCQHKNLRALRQWRFECTAYAIAENVDMPSHLRCRIPQTIAHSWPSHFERIDQLSDRSRFHFDRRRRLRKQAHQRRCQHNSHVTSTRAHECTVSVSTE